MSEIDELLAEMRACVKRIAEINNSIPEENKLFVIDSEDYDDLVFLNALETAGVDNWEGYSVAQEYFREFKGE